MCPGKVFAQNWHFALRVQTHVVILYAINSLAVPFQIPSRGWSAPNGSSHSEEFSFISNRKFSFSHNSVLTSCPLPSLDNLVAVLKWNINIASLYGMELRDHSSCFHVTYRYIFFNSYVYLGSCPHGCYSGSIQLPLVQITQTIPLASTPL